MPDLSHLDLVPVHMLLALVGAFATLGMMALSAAGRIAPGDKGCLRQWRRTGMFVIGAGFAWSLMFGLERDWQPWPPMLVIMLGADLYMITSIISAYVRRPERDAKLASVVSTEVGHDPYSSRS